MDSEGRALELAIELTPRAVPWLPGAMDLEGRLIIELTPRVISWLTGATMGSEGRALELVIELTPRAVSWLLGVVGWVELAGTVIFELSGIAPSDTETEGSSAPGI